MSKSLALLLLLTGAFATAQEITVAAAADMSAALPQLVAGYTKKTGQTVKLSFGASGNLTNQIRNGAPFDVFFSADEEYPQQLIAEGLAQKDTLYRYAVGRLVLWVPADSPLDLSKLGMTALLDPSVKKISVANPATAPYGRAAEAALRHFGIYDRVSSRLVVGENVSQAAQFVESGTPSGTRSALARTRPRNERQRPRPDGSARRLSHAESGGDRTLEIETSGCGPQIPRTCAQPPGYFPAHRRMVSTWLRRRTPTEKALK